MRFWSVPGTWCAVSYIHGSTRSLQLVLFFVSPMHTHSSLLNWMIQNGAPVSRRSQICVNTPNWNVSRTRSRAGSIDQFTILFTDWNIILNKKNTTNSNKPTNTRWPPLDIIYMNIQKFNHASNPFTSFFTHTHTILYTQTFFFSSSVSVFLFFAHSFNRRFVEFSNSFIFVLLPSKKHAKINC